MRFQKIVVTTCLVFLLLFTMACMALFYLTGGMEPGVLIGCVFGAITGELSICGYLKSRERKEKGEE